MRSISLSLVDCPPSQTQEEEGLTNNPKDYLLYVTFLGVENKNEFRIKSYKDISVGDFQGIVLHIESDSSNTMLRGLPLKEDSFTLKTIVKLKVKKNEMIRIFYWNDNSNVEVDEGRFIKCLKSLGTEKSGKLGSPLDCSLELAIPEEAGNGGVVGVTDCI